MPPILGNIIVTLILLTVVFFALRSMWKSHKKGGCGCGCEGCSGSCAGCSGAIPKASQGDSPSGSIK